MDIPAGIPKPPNEMKSASKGGTVSIIAHKKTINCQKSQHINCPINCPYKMNSSPINPEQPSFCCWFMPRCTCWRRTRQSRYPTSWALEDGIPGLVRIFQCISSKIVQKLKQHFKPWKGISFHLKVWSMSGLPGLGYLAFHNHGDRCCPLRIELGQRELHALYTPGV